LSANASCFAATFFEMNSRRHATQRRYPYRFIVRQIVVEDALRWSLALIRAYDFVQLAQDSETNKKMRRTLYGLRRYSLHLLPFRVVREEGPLIIC
jgi:hypothetical protein